MSIYSDLTNEEIAYFAGLIDGEGCIGIYEWVYKNKNWTSTYNLQFVLSNTDKKLIEWCIKKFGGHCTTILNKKINNSYQLRWKYKEAYEILKKIYPYLIIKKQQCGVAIKFLDIVFSTTGNDIKNKKKKEIFESNKNINRIGKVTPKNGRKRIYFHPNRVYTIR